MKGFNFKKQVNKYIFYFIVLLSSGCSITNQVLISDEELSLNHEMSNSKLFNDNFRMSGKFVIFLDDKGFSGSLLWLSKNNQDLLKIFNPFNTPIATVNLNYDKDKINFKSNLSEDKKNTNELLRKIFVNKENITSLKDLLVNPPSTLAYQNEVNTSIGQWDVKIEGLSKNKKVPQKIFLKKDNISLKLIIKEWQD